MNEKLNAKNTLLVSVMLFGMFFGAGNLIFPAYMGWLSGSRMWAALAGFLITGVGLPLLGVAAIGISRSNGLFDLAGHVGKGYAYFFTCALYLTIGPFFAIPRCATVPYSVGIAPLLGDADAPWVQAVFSFVFFAIVLAFSLKPGRILTWVGKILTPVFLVFLGVLIVTVLINPITAVSDAAPAAGSGYDAQAFMTGFLEGYNTMDALAGLAFGIVVVKAIRGLGIERDEAVAGNTVRAGVFSCVIMALIYLFVTLVGVMCLTPGVTVGNGGDVLAYAGEHYLGKAGLWILAVTVTLACLKTSVGLVTSCSETFAAMFPGGPSYRVWAIIFSGFSFLVANIGLSAIIRYAVPVLMLLYPLAITLILTSLCGKLFGHDRVVYGCVSGCALFAAVFDFLGALPAPVVSALRLDVLTAFAGRVLPLYGYGLGWLVPSLLGLAAGLAWHFVRVRKQG